MAKKQVIVTSIEWDAPKSAGLPKKIIIDISENNAYLLEDIDGYADNLCDYLSDEYGYCLKGFCVETVETMEHNFKFDHDKVYCRICNSVVGWRQGDRYLLSSSSEGDEGKGICHECLVDHCCNTDCLGCNWYKYPNCPHIETKKIYMDPENQ